MSKIVKFKGYPKLQKVWSRLLKQLPKEYHNLNLFFSNHNTHDYELRKGGWSHVGYIVIGAEFVNLKDEYIYAQMLAHELGHQVLGHNHHYNDKESSNEKDADHFGLFLAMRAGYDVNKYMEAIWRYEHWRRDGITKAHKISHGTAQERNDLLMRQIRYLGLSI